MTYQGHIQNGVVVFDEPVSLPDGTTVRVETAPTSEFWRRHSLDELAQEQEIGAPPSFDAVLGGWPDDELADGFEDAVVAWRRQELERPR